MIFRDNPSLIYAGLCLGLFLTGAAHAGPQAPIVKAVVPAAIEPKLVLAADMINSGDLVGAHDILNKAYQANPNDALVLYLEGIIQFKGAAYGDAAGSAAAAIDLDKTVAAYYYLRGVSVRYDPDMFQLDVQRATADDFKTAYTLDPTMEAAYRERAAATLYLTKLAPNYTAWYDGTVHDDISTALQLDPNDGEAHFIEGVENIADSDWQPARDDLARAVELGVNRSEVYEDLGSVDYHLNQVAQAAVDYQKALDVDPNNDTAKKNLAALKSGADLT